MIAKSFARIHMANLINFGIVPLTFADPDDYDRLGEGDTLRIADFRGAVGSRDTVTLTDDTTGREVLLRLDFTERQREILLAGGLLHYTKERNR